MSSPEVPLAQLSALVIDPDNASRARLASTLRDAGLARVEHVGRLDAARQRLEIRPVDIVLCEYRFPDEARTSLDLVEELRLAQLLPMSTVFLVVSSEAVASTVAETAEAALDGFVLKPFSQVSLMARVQEARARKRAIADVIAAVEKRDYAGAAALCEARIAERGPAAVTAARIGAELHLKLGQTERAQALFAAVGSAKPLPWATLGQARTLYQAGNLGHARRTLETLLEEQPSYADAYDAMGRVLVDQCDFEAALETFRRGCELTPGSTGRQQKLGLLAFVLGHDDEAQKALERATALGLGSANFDYQSLFILALLQHDRAQVKPLTRSRDLLKRALALHPLSGRLRRLESLASLLLHLLADQPAPAMERLMRLLDEIHSPDLDLETACNLLATLARVQAGPHARDDVADHARQLVQRFAVSKASAELMCRMSRLHPPFEAVIRSTYQATCAVIEAAASHSISGQPKVAVQLLLMQIEQTHNGKLIDVAEQTLHRHQAAIDGADLLALQLARWRERATGVGVRPVRSAVLSRPTTDRTASAAA